MVRAVFAGSSAVRNGTLRVGVGQSCETLAIVFTVGVGKGPGRVVLGWPSPGTAWGTRPCLCAGQGCPQDTLSPLVLRLTYDAVGDPISVAGGLRPALSEDSEMVAMGAVGAGASPEQRCWQGMVEG